VKDCGVHAEEALNEPVAASFSIAAAEWHSAYARHAMATRAGRRCPQEIHLLQRLPNAAQHCRISF